MNSKTEQIISLYDGKRSSKEVAEIVGLSPRYVRRIAQKFDLPRRSRGAGLGKNNHQYVSGRRIDLDGYALVTAPYDHPYARKRPGRNSKIIYEHRLVMEEKLGRYLLPSEIVDHIDGLTLHNAPENLRLFADNGLHLKETISGVPKRISKSGKLNIQRRSVLPSGYQHVDTYSLRRKSGDVRLRQILLAWLKLDKDSPFLLGTHRHLKKAGIDFSSRSKIRHALAELEKKWEELLLL